MDENETPNPVIRPGIDKNALAMHVVTVVVKSAITIGVLYILGRAAEKLNFNDMLKRVELVPAMNGRLVVNEYHAERLVKTRYATKEEEWQYSRDTMAERLTEMGLE